MNNKEYDLDLKIRIIFMVYESIAIIKLNVRFFFLRTGSILSLMIRKE